ncbi:DUF6161 domain-containing protein [Afipia broomeae]|uniref:DUF6161 domain-containing protein n=1 Tax=Afipia broomeae ATCC 49717 TaxID=883078 RepID=K8NVJ4_9BRAD|nr:DUF6161 domain-containing protein [Afipia broomeae]EKS34327.1 hypothetical protein HMPREF9695_04237 [Afipia broomeae ATCC 49717]
MAAISIDRAPRQTLTFNTPSDVLSFLNSESSFWAFTQSEAARHPYGPVNETNNRYSANWQTPIREALHKWQPDDHSSQTFHEIRERLQQRFGEQKRLSSRDADAIAVAALGSQNPRMAAVALATIDAPQLMYTDANFMSVPENRIGVARGFAILAGFPAGLPETLLASVEASVTAAQDEVARSRDARDLSEQESHDQRERIQSAASDQQLAHAEAFDTAEKTRQSEFELLRNDLAAVRTAYENRMQLEGPVRYWERKYKSHRNAKWATAAILIAYALGSLYWLNLTFQQAAAYLPKLNSTDPWPLPIIVREGLFALVVTTVVFWIGRVVLRVYFSNQHLASDAAERMTMVMTFLALTRKKLLTDADRSAILVPLFRSASDGIVKDDGAPDNALALLMTSLSKSKN